MGLGNSDLGFRGEGQRFMVYELGVYDLGLMMPRWRGVRTTARVPPRGSVRKIARACKKGGKGQASEREEISKKEKEGKGNKDGEKQTYIHTETHRLRD